MFLELFKLKYGACPRFQGGILKTGKIKGVEWHLKMSPLQNADRKVEFELLSF